MRTATIEVKKFNSFRAVPVVVLNKQRRRGDKEGWGTQIEKKIVNNPGQPKLAFSAEIQHTKLLAVYISSTCSPAPTIASRLELYSISTMAKAPIAKKKENFSRCYRLSYDFHQTSLHPKPKIAIVHKDRMLEKNRVRHKFISINEINKKHCLAIFLINFFFS